jgi:hypothetical protein
MTWRVLEATAATAAAAAAAAAAGMQVSHLPSLRVYTLNPNPAGIQEAPVGVCPCSLLVLVLHRQ